MVHKVPSIRNKKSSQKDNTKNISHRNKLSQKESSDCNFGYSVTTKQNTKGLNVNTPKKKYRIVDNSCLVSSKCRSMENQLNGIYFLRSLKRGTRPEQKCEKLTMSTPHHLNDVSCVVSPKRVTRSVKKTSEALLLASTPKIKQCIIKLQNCNIANKTTVKKILDKPYFKRLTNYRSEVNLNPDYLNIISTPSSEVMPIKFRQHSLKPKHVTSVTALKNIKKPPKKHGRPKKRNQTQMQCRSFAGCASVDELSIRKYGKRKAKSENFKIQHKSTLKRKRHVLDELNKANAGYEDDIFEFQKFDHFKDLLQDTGSMSDVSFSIETPKLGFHATPMPQKCYTPVFKDCISPTEYTIVRKIAQEVQHRKKRYISKSVKAEIEKSPVVPEKKKLEFDKVLMNLQEHQKVIKKITDQDNDSVDGDSYLLDC